MFSTLILLAALGQSPAPPAPKPALKHTPARATRDYSDVIARRRARNGSRTAAGRRQEAAQEAAAYRERVEAQAAYERALPFMLEQQRQMLQRQSEYERNVAAHRMATAAEKAAQAAEWAAWRQPVVVVPARPYSTRFPY